MNKDTMEDFKELICFLCVVLVFMFCLLLPFVWLEGHANSNWLKKTKNIDVVWYEAAFLEVAINSQDIQYKY